MTAKTRGFPWTEARIEMVALLRSRDMSWTRIAERLSTEVGVRVSRTAVRKRLECPERGSLTSATAAAAIAARKTRHKGHQRPDMVPPPAHIAGSVTLDELGPRDCRWLVSDAPAYLPPGWRAEHHRYCGAKAADGRSYCLKHHQQSLASEIEPAKAA